MCDEDIVWIASFDIGKINFCFYIEEFDKMELLKLDISTKLKGITLMVQQHLSSQSC